MRGVFPRSFECVIMQEIAWFEMRDKRSGVYLIITRDKLEYVVYRMEVSI